MAVTVEDVRFFLKNLPEDFVSDETILLQIDMAIWVVDKEKSSHATDDDIDKAVLVYAGYYTTLAYLEEAERAMGVVPPGLAALVNELHKLLEKALEYIRRGDVYQIPLALANLTDSGWDYRGGSTIKTCTAHCNNE